MRFWALHVQPQCVLVALIAHVFHKCPQFLHSLFFHGNVGFVLLRLIIRGKLARMLSFDDPVGRATSQNQRMRSTGDHRNNLLTSWLSSTHQHISPTISGPCMPLPVISWLQPHRTGPSCFQGCMKSWHTTAIHGIPLNSNDCGCIPCGWHHCHSRCSGHVTSPLWGYSVTPPPTAWCRPHHHQLSGHHTRSKSHRNRASETASYMFP